MQRAGASLPPRDLDVLFLVLVVWLPSFLYLPGLGFYSDDWGFLAAMGEQPGGSLWQYIRWMLPAADLRPGHAVYAALTYFAFGLSPTGYHVVNHVMIVLILVLLASVLRWLGLARSLALAAATIYGLMPSYSTLRFWFAVHMANASLLAYLLSLSIDLRAPARTLRGAIGWRALSAALALSSVLLYELVMPLLLLNPFAAWWLRHGRPAPRMLGRPGARPDRRLALDLVISLGIVIAAAGYKIMMSSRASGEASAQGALLGRLLRLARGIVNHHGITYGVAEPLSLWTSLTRYFDLWTLLVALLVGIGVALYLFQVLAWSPPAPPTSTRSGARRRLGAVMLLGLMVLGLGYLVFVTNDQFYFSAAGTTNRITQIGSLGVAIVLAGLFGLLSTFTSSPTLWRAVLAGLVGLYGAAGVLLLGTIGSFWVEAYRRELAIVDGIRGAVPTMASGSTLLLDGECAYHGPAIVFESSWDLRGVVRLSYQDPSLKADIISARFDVYDHAVTTWLETPDARHEYRYADGLVVYNHRHGVVVPIRDAGEMERYLERYNRTRDNGCPFGWPGNGVTILPRPLPGG